MRGAISGARSGANGTISRSMSGPTRGARSGVEWRRDRRPVGLGNDDATSCTISRMVSGAVSGAIQWVDEGRKEGRREERCDQSRDQRRNEQREEREKGWRDERGHE